MLVDDLSNVGLFALRSVIVHDVLYTFSTKFTNRVLTNTSTLVDERSQYHNSDLINKNAHFGVDSLDSVR